MNWRQPRVPLPPAANLNEILSYDLPFNKTAQTPASNGRRALALCTSMLASIAKVAAHCAQGRARLLCHRAGVTV